MINAPGGPFLFDTRGRIVLFHGVNAVYKYPPYELYPAPGRPFDFSSEDATTLAALGFNVVRLGIVWEGLEPGTLGPNDPSICTPGLPADPAQFNGRVIDAYLAHVRQTVDLLGHDGIYTILDMHQDLYSSVFGGEGAPPWATCTDGLPTTRLPGRWSNTYASPALQAAFGHFWRNDVVGDLQGNYDRVWGVVASYFANDPWILGYDPMNEPFSTTFLDVHHHVFDAELECFYTGRGHPGRNSDVGAVVSCPPDDPVEGVIPTIEAHDRHHLIFYEPDIFSKGGSANYIGPMHFPRLVLNFHDYCPERDPFTGDPTTLALCLDQVTRTILRRELERTYLGSGAQALGPPLFMSEFGATASTDLLGAVVGAANQNFLGWTYWSWKYYADPTGSSDEALERGTGGLKPSAVPLAAAYPEAIAGTPTAITSDPVGGRLGLEYLADPVSRAPTVIAVPEARYRGEYCTKVEGGVVTSRPGAALLTVRPILMGSAVEVTVMPGACHA